jgi:DNA-damage-inducible protein D
MDKHTLISWLEGCKRQTSQGMEYWMARDLQAVLGYSRWENFVNVVEKARMACESAGVDADHQFREVTKGITAGKGAELQRSDYYLSRYACYLIAMNGDPGKPEVGYAQTYFAVQTRRQEVRDQHDVQRRLELRERVREANRALGSAAKGAGVQKYALFHDAGYMGLYGMGLSDLKAHKRLEPADNLLDRAGRVELAANEFRITQTEDKLRRDQVRGEAPAIQTHLEVGEAVRRTIRHLGGRMPEDLPPEPSIKRLASKRRPAKGDAPLPLLSPPLSLAHAGNLGESSEV